MDLVELQELPGHTDRVWHVAWSPDGAHDDVRAQLRRAARLKLLSDAGSLSRRRRRCRCHASKLQLGHDSAHLAAA
jgi:hypothetical protein